MADIVPVPKKAKVTELNDYRHVALPSVIMKCFERLVKGHITSTLPVTLDPLKFAYRPNRSTDDAIAITLHTALSHLDKRNTYVRMLFIDYSSAFNTCVSSKLIIELEALGLNPARCDWVQDILTGRPPGGEGRKQHLHFADPQPWGPTRVSAQSPPVLPVHP
jgi:gmma-aminobutyric acid receptor subunit gamma/cGMP-dependent protein kinase 2